MTRKTLEILAQQAAAGDKAASDTLLNQIEAILRQLDRATLDRVVDAAQELRGPPDQPGTPLPTPITAELMDWARKQFTEEELVDGLRELREHGGIEFPVLLQGTEAQPDGQ
jgi:hypothetical protein